MRTSMNLPSGPGTFEFGQFDQKKIFDERSLISQVYHMRKHCYIVMQSFESLELGANSAPSNQILFIHAFRYKFYKASWVETNRALEHQGETYVL